MTNLLGNQVVSISSAPEIDAPAAHKKQSWLPLLTVLFLISYGLMTMLIVEQGQTIESQRSLIRELFRDSQELSAVKRAQQEGARGQAAQTQTPAQNRSSQNRSTQYPSNENPSTQAPSRQHRKMERRKKLPSRNRSSECRRNKRQTLWMTSET